MPLIKFFIFTLIIVSSLFSSLYAIKSDTSNIDNVSLDKAKVDLDKLIKPEENEFKLVKEVIDPGVIERPELLNYGVGTENYHTELLRYYKCFTLISRSNPDPDDNTNYTFEGNTYNVASVISFLKNRGNSDDDKKEMAVNGCMALLEHANLIQSGNNFELDTSDNMGRKILKNFHDFHQTWFENRNPFDNRIGGTTDIHPYDEAALRITKTLFHTDSIYSDVLSGTDSYRPMRSGRDNVSNQYVDGFVFLTTNKDPDQLLGPDGTFSPSFFTYPLTRSFSFNNTRQGQSQFYELSVSSLPTENQSKKAGLWVPDPINFSSVHYPSLSSNYFENINEYYSYPEGESITSIVDSGCDNTYPSLVHKGEITGVSIKEKGDCVLSHFTDPSHSEDSNTEDMFNHLGGGAIGNINYLLLNSEGSDGGGTMYVTHTDAVNFNRRWARYVIKDFACRDIPVINYSNLSDFDGISTDEYAVQDDEDVYGAHSFRMAGECLECHATIDSMSAVTRNARIVENGNRDYADMQLMSKTSLLTNYDYTKCSSEGSLNDCTIGCNRIEDENCPTGAGGSVYTATDYDEEIGVWNNRIWPSATDTTTHFFPRSHPFGRFIFDDLYGEEIRTNITGVHELATELTKTVDYYACAVKHYFEFFTGENIPFFSDYEGSTLTPRATGELSELQLDKFEWIRTLGRMLRDGGSYYSPVGNARITIDNLQSVIQMIINSDYFMESIIGYSEGYDEFKEIEAESDFEATKEVLKDRCWSCHKSDGTYSSVFNIEETLGEMLESDSIESDWNGKVTYSSDKVLIEPGVPCDSLLFLKLSGSDTLADEESNIYCDGHSENANMPYEEEPLSNEHLKSIYNWILNM